MAKIGKLTVAVFLILVVILSVISWGSFSRSYAVSAATKLWSATVVPPYYMVVEPYSVTVNIDSVENKTQNFISIGQIGDNIYNYGDQPANGDTGSPTFWQRVKLIVGSLIKGMGGLVCVGAIVAFVVLLFVGRRFLLVVREYLPN